MTNRYSRGLLCFGIFMVLNISCTTTRLIEKDFTVTGIAHSSKLGAIVWVKNGRKAYFVEDLNEWPNDIEDRMVRVRGLLYKEKSNLKRVAEDGSTYVVQGVKDFKRIIKYPTWELKE